MLDREEPVAAAVVVDEHIESMEGEVHLSLVENTGKDDCINICCLSTLLIRKTRFTLDLIAEYLERVVTTGIVVLE